MPENMPAMWRNLTGTDPAWMPRIIAILQRDYPAVWEEAIARAITENAIKLDVRKEPVS
jgi:hypothetical protein